MVRQLHVPEAGELIHEEGVLFNDSVENILEDKSQRHRTVRWALLMMPALQALHPLYKGLS